MRRQSCWGNISYDVLLEWILCHFELKIILNGIAMVNKETHVLAETDGFWNVMAYRTFNNAALECVKEKMTLPADKKLAFLKMLIAHKLCCVGFRTPEIPAEVIPACEALMRRISHTRTSTFFVYESFFNVATGKFNRRIFDRMAIAWIPEPDQRTFIDEGCVTLQDSKFVHVGDVTRRVIDECGCQVGKKAVVPAYNHGNLRSRYEYYVGRMAPRTVLPQLCPILLFDQFCNLAILISGKRTFFFSEHRNFLLKYLSDMIDELVEIDEDLAHVKKLKKTKKEFLDADLISK